MEPDDFDELYADELDLLNDMEESVPQIDFGQKNSNKISSSLKAITPEPSPKKPLKADTAPGKQCLNGQSRKRGLEEMFGPMSDSEDELVIDAPPLENNSSPLAKKLRQDAGKTALSQFSKERDAGRTAVSQFSKEQDAGKPALSQFSKVADDFEITPPPSPEKELETLQRIKTQRDLAQIRSLQDAVTSTLTDSAVDPVLEKLTVPPRQKKSARVLNRQPEGSSITVTAADGRRVFLKKQEGSLQATLSKNGEMSFTHSASKMALLQTSILQLRQQIEEERHQQLILESQIITQSIDREKPSGTDRDEEDLTPEEQNKNNLWVDRYAPRNYTELLSDDGINRNILFWLKLWDRVVFGRERKQRPKPQENKKPQNQYFNNPNFKNFKKTEDLNDELDDHNRPMHPVALLCGPPGLGKTTLAHIIALHAGYNPVEINASDDRSLEVFRNRLESATQMKSVLTKDKRPNCLIIDEIDGSPVPTINYLVNLAKKGELRATGKKKKKPQQLQRPIICICNDLYVPALRPLRQIAYVSHFPPTMSARLASRMQQISRENLMKTDLTTLIALATKAENDIRSCLNTLQFLHRQGKPVNLSMIHSLNVGQKDQHKGLFVTWQEIFQLPRPKRKQFVNPHDIDAGRASLPRGDRQADGNPASLSSRFHRVLSLAMTCGEYTKQVQGIFENYLDVKFKDPHLDSITLASDWLIFTDLLNTRIAKTQNYIFNRYMPFTPVVFHMLFACVSRPQIKYPSADFETHQKQQKIQHHVNSMLSEASPSTKKMLDLTIAVKEVVPLLQIIISPTFRPVSTQLFSMQEKRQLAELVSIMIAFNLTYHQERNMEGQYNYVLDPNLEEVTRFSDTPNTRQLSYGAKQLISREIEIDKLRRREQSFSSAPLKPSTAVSGSAKQSGSNPAVPRHKQKLAPKVLDNTDNKPVKDFFSRFKKMPRKSRPVEATKKTQEKEPEEKLVTGKIWFQFTQGFTNAVRKTVRMQDML